MLEDKLSHCIWLFDGNFSFVRYSKAKNDWNPYKLISHLQIYCKIYVQLVDVNFM